MCDPGLAVQSEETSQQRKLLDNFKIWIRTIYYGIILYSVKFSNFNDCNSVSIRIVVVLNILMTNISLENTLQSMGPYYLYQMIQKKIWIYYI